jgi:malto-oligosyltrehalose trehalohydrolase
MGGRGASWGAEILDDGARFALWAPAARRVALAAGGRLLPMEDAGDGWRTLTTDAVPPGGLYAFDVDGATVPDPAAREQAGDVHGPSRLIDPAAFRWRRLDWRGRPWEEAVIYELHVGTFTPAGDFDGAVERLPRLADLGITTVELMPVAQFAGRRGWGYDGVLPFAPHVAYGGSDGLKRFVDAAHGLGLTVLLDVVYNHFGPEGLHLRRYAPDFFDPARRTPWGDAIAYDRRPVRDFFVQNAAYWIAEHRLDGLRLDAIDRIAEADDTLLEEIALAARAAAPERHVHLCTEDDRNVVALHARDLDNRPRFYTAEWNDDLHHAAHVAATGETAGYYADYADRPAERLARALSSGFDYQGQRSRHLGRPRGEPSGHLPPTAFVAFLQNHDQIGNRAFGERLGSLAAPGAVRTLTAILLLSPQIPLLFMGEEWGETRPFLFFADFEGDLAAAVREGRRAEFAYWPDMADPARRETVPDPCDPATFAASRLDWDAADRDAAGLLALTRTLLDLRRRVVVPRLGGLRDGSADAAVFGDAGLTVRWRLDDGTRLRLGAVVGPDPAPVPPMAGDALFETAPGLSDGLRAGGPMPGWSALWTVEAP